MRVDLATLTDDAFERLPLVSRGASKVVRDAGDGRVVIRFLPTVYSFTHHRAGTVAGTDALRLRATRVFVEILRAAGLDHAYLEVGERFVLARHVPEPPPIEVILKRRHVGTPKHRYVGMAGHPVRASHATLAGRRVSAGEPYPQGVHVRFDWRNPARHPTTGERLADEVLPEALADLYIDVRAARETALAAYQALDAFLAPRGVELEDLCLFVTEDGRTIYGEVSPDCGRFRHVAEGPLDKDVWRAGGSSELVAEKWRRLVELVEAAPGRRLDGRVP